MNEKKEVKYGWDGRKGNTTDICYGFKSIKAAKKDIPNGWEAEIFEYVDNDKSNKALENMILPNNAKIVDEVR